MDEFYTIPDNPRYSEDIRKLQDSDPASASETFNPVFQQIVENVAAVKQQAESKQDKLTGTQGQVVGFDADGNAVPQKAPDTGASGGMSEEEADKRYLQLTGGVVLGDVRIGSKMSGTCALIMDGLDGMPAGAYGTPSQIPCTFRGEFGYLNYTTAAGEIIATRSDTAPYLSISGRTLKIETIVHMGRNKIRELGDPVYPYDAATKYYVDSLVAQTTPGYKYLVFKSLQETITPAFGRTPCYHVSATIFTAYPDPVAVDKQCRLDFWINDVDDTEGVYTSVFLHALAGESNRVLTRHLTTPTGEEAVLIVDVEVLAKRINVYLADPYDSFRMETVNFIIGYLPSEQAGGEMEKIFQEDDRIGQS